MLIMTGHGTVETAIRALRQGVDGLILKPFGQGSELIDAVKLALADSQQKRDAARTQALRPLFSVTDLCFLKHAANHCSISSSAQSVGTCNVHMPPAISKMPITKILPC